MNIFEIIFVCIFTYIFAAPQQPQTEFKYDKQAEIPDQFEKLPQSIQPQKVEHEDTTANPDISPDTTSVVTTNHDEIHEITNPRDEVAEVTFTTKLYSIVAVPIKRFIATPKVNTVLRNIGTCVVNGAMEIISHFFPTPLMPLIASAAGMIIPFEPVVMLKERMPVTSYRRAIKTAVNSFMDTFDKYKIEGQEEDPYMTRQFYRRFMNDKDTKVKS